MERLQKVMAHAGIASRRQCEDIIEAGRVKINGEIATELGTKVDPEEDDIEVDGDIITKEKKIYLLLNKPEGYITTVDDPQNRKTVMDLIGDIKQRIYPVGRLDRDSSGLLLMTNNGNLTHKLTHPSYEIDKKYMVQVKGKMDNNKLEKLEYGVKLKDGITAPAQVKLLDRNETRTLFSISIHEGKNRQVRRMCRKLGHEVVELKRVAFAFFTVGELKTGNYRFLTKTEVEKLKNLVS